MVMVGAGSGAGGRFGLALARYVPLVCMGYLYELGDDSDGEVCLVCM